jgi:CubicO group peptidase (beta-lactamase class C family)
MDHSARILAPVGVSTKAGDFHPGSFARRNRRHRNQFVSGALTLHESQRRKISHERTYLPAILRLSAHIGAPGDGRHPPHGGRRFLPASWIEQSLSRDPIAGLVHTTDGWVSRGKYQWFLTRDGRAYFAKGYEGQYVFVVPSRHTVIVRFGEGYGTTDWPALFLRLADSL